MFKAKKSLVMSISCSYYTVYYAVQGGSNFKRAVDEILKHDVVNDSAIFVKRISRHGVFGFAVFNRTPNPKKKKQDL